MTTDYSTCIHEGAHGVAASLLDVSWFHAITVHSQSDGALGRLIHDRGWTEDLRDDPDSNWKASAWAITALAGPVAHARWIQGEYAERIHVGRIPDFGGASDLDIAQAIGETWDISIQNLLGHAIELVHNDRCWLAIQRVADALVDQPVLISTDVDRLVGKKARGSGNW